VGQPGPAAWRRGLELFHAGRWFEAHELFEDCWLAFGRATAEGRLARGLVQLAAAELKRGTGGPAAPRLAERACRTLEGLPPLLLGVRVAELVRAIRAVHAEGEAGPVRIPLDWPISSLK
jgi:predicted metal-dependent hydrolase